MIICTSILKSFLLVILVLLRFYITFAIFSNNNQFYQNNNSVQYWNKLVPTKSSNFNKITIANELILKNNHNEIPKYFTPATAQPSVLPIRKPKIHSENTKKLVNISINYGEDSGRLLYEKLDKNWQPQESNFIENSTMSNDHNDVEGRKLKTVKKKFQKLMLPILIAYKLKFFTLIPVLIGGLILLVGTTGMAGFFFALFAAVMSMKSDKLTLKRIH